MPAEIGASAPAFSLRDPSKENVSLEDFEGRKTLLVFIPFPFTGNCEAELCTLRDHLADLNELDVNSRIDVSLSAPCFEELPPAICENVWFKYKDRGYFCFGNFQTVSPSLQVK